MNFRSAKKQEFEIFSNSFSDIMFFLMLFFLIVSTMVTPGAIKLALPQANKSPAIDKQTDKLSISITKDLKYYVNDKEIPFSQIEPELLKFKQGKNDAFVIVRCDNSIEVQSMVDVVQLGNKVGVKMVLATTKKDSSVN
ncbi:MAG TPA: biopolymer transporter ExbD [Prolixibacteraceae bacterium]|jgi:biopolymer transport protein ExbD|nr:biopolymer transporter ExbD [Prolixibacteraceae bacterium]